MNSTFEVDQLDKRWAIEDHEKAVRRVAIADSERRQADKEFKEAESHASAVYDEWSKAQYELRVMEGSTPDLNVEAPSNTKQMKSEAYPILVPILIACALLLGVVGICLGLAIQI